MKLLNNFLNSGHVFSEDEYEQQSKYILFNSVLSISTFIVLILITMQALHGEYLLVVLNSIQIGFILIGMLVLRYSRVYFSPVVYTIFALVMALLFFTILLYPDDYMRIAWFLALIIIAFLLNGSRLGYAVSAFSLLTVTIAFILHHSEVAAKPYLLMFGFILLITLLVHLYDTRENSVKKRLKTLNVHLEERVADETKKRMELYRKSHEKLEEMAHYDALTKLPNRVLFFDRLRQSILKSKRNRTKLAVLFLDLDNFKEINDTYGHIFGDEILKTFSKRLQSTIRNSDTLSRFGGDEFVVILEDIHDASAVIRIVKTLEQVIQQNITVDKRDFFLTTSMGVAIYPEDGQDAVSLIKNADVAMYDAKKNGRNQIAFYTQKMTEYSHNRLMMDQEIRQGIQKNEFVLYYQPIIDNRNATLAGLEALVRWNHPQKGFIMPDNFIPIAEMSSHIIGIGERVLQQVSEQITLWHQKGFDPPNIAVNISPKQLRSSGLIALLKQTLESVPFRRDWLEIEITEGYAIQNLENAINKLHKIRELGITLSLDDFGTGYSSLSYLKKLPVDKLKIDRSFVSDILVNKEDRILVKAIVSFSREMGIKTVAEGVEGAEQFALMEQIGCTYSQGYYFSQPVPPSIIEKKYFKMKGN